jgi:HEAT repeat protein
MTAASALGELNDPQAVNWLVSLLRDADPTVRTAASHSLQRLGWRPTNDSQRTLQVLASGNLRQVADLGAEAIVPLAEVMRNGPPDKQLQAVKALGEISDPRVVKVMLEALKKSSPVVRIAALGILERYADASTYERVEPLLKDSNPNVRAAAVEAAARCGVNRAVPALVRALKDSSWDVRHAATAALGFIGDRSAVAGLSQMLQDADRDVRESTVLALGRIGDPSAIRTLLLAMLDVESVVRNAAANAMRLIDRHWEQSAAVRQALPEIKAALDHHEYWVRHSALKLFEQLRIDPDSIGSQSPIDATPQPPEPSAHPALFILTDLIRDADRDLRLAAADALGRLPEKSAGEILAFAANDSDAFVRQAAQNALAALD